MEITCSISFELQYGFYAVGIAEQDHYYFTVDVRRGHLFRPPDLPIC